MKVKYYFDAKLDDGSDGRISIELEAPTLPRTGDYVDLPYPKDSDDWIDLMTVQVKYVVFSYESNDGQCSLDVFCGKEDFSEQRYIDLLLASHPGYTFEKDESYL